MELALQRDLNAPAQPGTRPVRPARFRPAKAEAKPGKCAEQGAFGTSTGVNIAPGSDDDGWTVPDPVELADGTTVHLHKDGEALHAAYAAIEAAKIRVCLEVYIFANDDTGRAFADLLARKSREGVRVYVLYDSFGTRGLYGREPDMIRRMRESGVRVQQFHPMRPWECRYTWRPLNRDHRKMLIVDNDIAGMGGLNVGIEYSGGWVSQALRTAKKGHPLKAFRVIGSGGARADQMRPIGSRGDAPDGAPTGLDTCDPWRDTAVAVRGPGARMFREAFAHAWRYVSGGGRIGRAQHVFNLCPSGAGDDLGVLASVPTMKSPLRPWLCSVMRQARKSIWMTMAYFVPDDELVTELCRAERRGVDVRLMLPGRSDVQAVQVAARSFYDRLMRAGIQIYERQGAVLHAKTMVIDGHTSIIGSTNLDTRSIEYNCELSAVIRSDAFGRQMHDLFENDVRFARRIDPREWRQRPFSDRCLQWAVSRARYLL
jgi:cardiolipin synthase